MSHPHTPHPLATPLKHYIYVRGGSALVDEISLSLGEISPSRTKNFSCKLNRERAGPPTSGEVKIPPFWKQSFETVLTTVWYGWRTRNWWVASKLAIQSSLWRQASSTSKSGADFSRVNTPCKTAPLPGLTGLIQHPPPSAFSTPQPRDEDTHGWNLVSMLGKNSDTKIVHCKSLVGGILVAQKTLDPCN